MGIKGHQISISLATVHDMGIKRTPKMYITSYGTDMGITEYPNQYITSYGTDMGIKGHQSSISLATVQIWVLKDTKAVYH